MPGGLPGEKMCPETAMRDGGSGWLQQQEEEGMRPESRISTHTVKQRT